MRGKKVFWDDWLVFKIVCEDCYQETADAQWLGPNGYQLNAQEKLEQWRMAGEQLRNTRFCEECGKVLSFRAAA